jgi:hypothetical protein
MASRKERNTIDQKKRNFTLGIVEEGVAHKVQDFHSFPPSLRNANTQLAVKLPASS